MATASAIFDSYADAAAAVQRVKQAGVGDGDISLVSNDAAADRGSYGPYTYSEEVATTSAAASGAGLGTVVGGAAGLLAGLGIIAIPGLGPVVAAGWLAAIAVGAGTGAVAGGLVGGLIGSGVSEDEAHAYAEGVRRGGTLVSVRVPEGDLPRIQAALDRGSYSLAYRAAQWRNEGWARRSSDEANGGPER